MSPRTTRHTPASVTEPRPSLWRWLGFALPLVLLAILVAYTAISEAPSSGPDRATPFELAATDGQTFSLEASLAEGDTLLYFSMGVGCSGCFLQIPELEAQLAERGVVLLPIMVDPAPLVAAEAASYGITTPILIDTDRRVADAYGMLGVYGHSDRPSHSFALVRQDGSVGWVRHYAEMFVPAGDLLAELDANLGAGAA
ncbi:MAG: hypothetical protein A2135_10230 [Actinobacteria bacterium RBG_16_67_15]|nr:MAG: hypothetical protein A2135_10230 [Actinobacteria bacterium RBG_16_67_15]